MRIAINGFGRIGRTILRQILTQGLDIDVVRVNDIAPPETCAYLFAYDSTFGPYPGAVRAKEGRLHIDDLALPLSHESDLRNLDLSGVDLLVDCTGIARSTDLATRGLDAGAARVLISGPSPAADTTVVIGANDDVLRDQLVVSNASCTTNALGPLMRGLDDRWGVQRAHMTTIHCYTNSQPMVDAPRGDLARSRAGALSMVPTTSSATHLIEEILPHLAGRISGAAVRVPSASVSAVDLTVQIDTALTQAEAIAGLRSMAENSPVMSWTDQPLVSSDLRARPESLILALPETLLIDGSQLRVFGWYDNEWGFSARMIDMIRRMAPN